MQDRVAALAAGLGHHLQLECGSVAALAVKGSDLFFETLLALLALGVTPALINLRWSSFEAAEAVQSCNARAVLADSSGLRLLHTSTLPSVEVDSELDQRHGRVSSANLLQQFLGAPYQPIAPSGGAAVICFTSGSTGRSKGAVISHSALHVQALAKLLVVGYKSTDVYLHCAPLFHVGGLSSALAMLMVGAQHVFVPDYQPEACCRSILRHQVRDWLCQPYSSTKGCEEF